jgi:hypothetical protein
LTGSTVGTDGADVLEEEEEEGTEMGAGADTEEVRGAVVMLAVTMVEVTVVELLELEDEEEEMVRAGV